MLSTIQTPTMTLWVMRKVGVPKKRANRSAFCPNQSLPNESACGGRVAAGRMDPKTWAAPLRALRFRGREFYKLVTVTNFTSPAPKK
jgi:hypothetical protein